MLRLLPVAAVAVAAMGFAVPRAAAATTCEQNEAAILCASATDQPTTAAIGYEVTQLDGPGSYSVYYVSDATGAVSNALAVGPLDFQGTAAGTFYAGQSVCYHVHLDSASGPNLIVGPVCG